MHALTRQVLIFGLLYLSTRAHGQAPQVDEFHQDFRLVQELQPPLTYFGFDVGEVTKLEKEGLRFTFPKFRKVPDRVGIILNTRIKGDFEATVLYEILKGDRPFEGHGVGVEFALSTESATKEELAVFRAVRVDEGEVYITSHTSTIEGQLKYRVQTIPAICKAGRLKITRVGKEAVLWASEDDSKVYEELRRVELGDEDVTMIRVAAYPGHKQNELDLRIKELKVRHLRADENIAQAIPIEKKAAPIGNWLITIVFFCLFTFLFGLLAIFFFYRQQKASKNLDQTDTFSQAPTHVSFACTHCGKYLKVKAAFAGKKVKCPECSTSVLVPSLEPSEEGK